MSADLGRIQVPFYKSCTQMWPISVVVIALDSRSRRIWFESQIGESFLLKNSKLYRYSYI